MDHPHFKIENPVLAALHFDAASAANTAAPLGPFCGAWWEHYLAEVIRQAQAELLDVTKQAADREKDELAAENAKLREQLQAALNAPRLTEPPPAEEAPKDPVKGVATFNPFKQD